jgi:hypothetical protein
LSPIGLAVAACLVAALVSACEAWAVVTDKRKYEQSQCQSGPIGLHAHHLST